jgi:catechol 2,3-dioxygenase-like lactoylglutathione lyase family enzyme
VRYQVKDVSRSVAFYTHHLGFRLEHQQLPACSAAPGPRVPALCPTAVTRNLVAGIGLSSGWRIFPPVSTR